MLSNLSLSFVHVSLYSYFYLYLSSLLLPLSSLPPSIHQQPMLSKTVRLIFSPSFILKHHIIPIACLLFHLFIRPSSSIWWLSLWQWVIVGRQDGYPNFPDSLSSRSIMRLYLCIVSVPCMCLLLRDCLWALCHELSQGYLRCRRVSASAFFSLPQGASFCHYDGAAVVVLMLFSSSFYPWILSLQHQIEELTYIATCLHSLAFLNCCFPLWHLWNQNTKAPRLMHT